MESESIRTYFGIFGIVATAMNLAIMYMRVISAIASHTESANIVIPHLFAFIIIFIITYGGIILSYKNGRD